MSDTKLIQELPGVGAATAEKLLDAGFDTLMAIAVATPGELTELVGMGETAAKRVINAARQRLDMGFESGEDLLKKREQVIKITTGAKGFDTLLGGGFETGSISECYGEFGSSKTQIGHVLACAIQLPKEQGGADGMAVYIDGEGAFRPERIVQFAKGFNLDPQEVLKKIKVARAFNSDHQILLAEKVEDLITKEKLPIKLVIVDSLTAHFRAEFVGRGTLAERQQKLNKHMHTLAKIASVHNLCVYVTNQVMAKPDTFFGDPTTAIGGNIVGHNCVLADTLIEAADGAIFPILQAMEKEKVLAIDWNSHQARAGKIGTIVIKSNIPEGLFIETTKRITTSPQHRFFKLEGLKIEEVEAKDLKKGDFIAHSFAQQPETKVQQLPKVEQEMLAIVDQKTAARLKEAIQEQGLTRAELCTQLAITPRQLRRVLNAEAPTKRENIAVLCKVVGTQLQLQEVETTKHKIVQMPTTLTENMAQLFGYFIGDGHSDTRSIRWKDERKEVLETYQQLAKEEFKKTGTIRKVKEKNCYELSLNSVAIKELFDTTPIIELIAQSPKEQVAKFLKGFFDADGHISKKEGRICLAQKDEKTIISAQMLCDRLGIRTVLHKKKNNKTGYIFFLNVQDNEALCRFATQVGFTAQEKRRRLAKRYKIAKQSYKQVRTGIRRNVLQNWLRQCRFFPSHFLQSRTAKEAPFVGHTELNKVVSLLIKRGVPKKEKQTLEFLEKICTGNVRFEEIRTCKRVNTTGKLYVDFAVPTLGNYNAQGFIVHNSQTRLYLRKGKKGTRVAKLIDSPHLPDGETIFEVTENGLKDV